MARHKDIDWKLAALDDRGFLDNDRIRIALLMDLRDELKLLRKSLSAQLDGIRILLHPKPRQITKRQAARILARARNRKIA